MTSPPDPIKHPSTRTPGALLTVAVCSESELQTIVFTKCRILSPCPRVLLLWLLTTPHSHTMSRLGVLGMLGVVGTLLLLVMPASQGAIPPGWRMVDRFAGFRFEVFGAVADTPSALEEVQRHADEVAGFGWVQVAPSGRVVGEFRGTPSTAKSFQTWLAKDSSFAGSVERVAIRVYSDTKIRYHFSHFKILNPARQTCFEDAPHQCQASSTDGPHAEL